MPRSVIHTTPPVRHALDHLGHLVRQQRIGRRLTQQQVADWMGYSRTTVAAIEKGDPNVSIGKAFGVAAYLGVPLFQMTPSELARAAHDSGRISALLPQRVITPTSDEEEDW